MTEIDKKATGWRAYFRDGKWVEEQTAKLSKKKKAASKKKAGSRKRSAAKKKARAKAGARHSKAKKSAAGS